MALWTGGAPCRRDTLHIPGQSLGPTHPHTHMEVKLTVGVGRFECPKFHF